MQGRSLRQLPASQRKRPLALDRGVQPAQPPRALDPWPGRLRYRHPTVPAIHGAGPEPRYSAIRPRTRAIKSGSSNSALPKMSITTGPLSVHRCTCSIALYPSRSLHNGLTRNCQRGSKHCLFLRDRSIFLRAFVDRRGPGANRAASGILATMLDAGRPAAEHSTFARQHSSSRGPARGAGKAPGRARLA